MTILGLSQAMIITLLIGAGLGTAVASTPEWEANYDGTPGSLLVSAYSSLGSLGKFCAVVNVVGVVANNAPGAYSMAMNFQMLGDFFARFPRPVFTVLTTVVYTACAMGGRDSLYQIFKNFLPLVGYWIVIWVVIVVEEDLVFNRGKGYDWAAWNDRQKLPVGVAAAVAFLVGWVGAVVGMVSANTILPGPVLRLICLGSSVLYRTSREGSFRWLRSGYLACWGLYGSCISGIEGVGVALGWSVDMDLGTNR